MIKEYDKRAARERRRRRVRAKLNGTAARPRLAVFRSNEHIYVQLINDEQGDTLAAASTLDKPIREKASSLNKTAEAREVGRLIAERAQAAGIKNAVFDRGGFLYHGRIAALADAARAGGLEF